MNARWMFAALAATTLLSISLVLHADVECEKVPAGYMPVDPKIPGGATCRGACGGGCNPRACKPIMDFSSCKDDPATGKGYLCAYSGLECGTHPGCRSHDACFDKCERETPNDKGKTFACKNGCSSEIAFRYPPWKWVSWARGGGPYDGKIKFTNPPSRIGPLPTSCSGDTCTKALVRPGVAMLGPAAASCVPPGGMPDAGPPPVMVDACYVDAPANHSQASVMDVCQNGHIPFSLSTCDSYASSCEARCGGPGKGSCVQGSCRSLGLPNVSAGGCGYDGYEDMPAWDVQCICNKQP